MRVTHFSAPLTLAGVSHSLPLQRQRYRVLLDPHRALLNSRVVFRVRFPTPVARRAGC
jgi:hypothetical protein